MKINLLIIFTVVFVSCSDPTKIEHDAKDNQNSKKIIKNSVAVRSIKGEDLIDEFYQTEQLENIWTQSKKIIVENQVINVNDEPYNLVLTTLSDWNDPGDYLRIEIFNSKKESLLVHTNFDGWVKFKSSFDLPISIEKLNQISSDHLMVLNIDEQRYLFLFGYAYASMPGLLSIIELSSQPKLIFNQLFQLKDLKDKNGDYYLDLVGTKDFDSMGYIDLFNRKMKIN